MADKTRQNFHHPEIIETWVDNSDGTYSLKVAATTTAAVGGATETTLATRLSEADFDTKTGALTETAPATDTASSGVNGRLQRVAQRLTSLIGLLPTSLGSNTAANSLPVTLSTDGQFVTSTGGLTETAPATDTASSGLNGRLQRIAQRLTSLIALVPAAVTGAGNFKVSLQEGASGSIPSGAIASGAIASGAISAGAGVSGAFVDGAIATLGANADAAVGDATGTLNAHARQIAKVITAGVTVDSELSAAAVLADAEAMPTTARVGSYGYVYNGTTEDRIRSASGASNTTGTGLPGAALMGFDGTNFQLGRVISNAGVSYPGMALFGQGSGGAHAQLAVGTVVADNNGGGQSLSTVQSSWNATGGAYDRIRNNTDVILLASAARTTTQTSADIITYNLGAITLILDMTVVGTGSVTVTINGKDLASGKYYLLLSGAAVVTNVTNVYVVDPAIPAVANVSAQKRLPRVIQVVVTAGNANSATYSCGYTLQLC